MYMSGLNLKKEGPITFRRLPLLFIDRTDRKLTLNSGNIGQRKRSALTIVSKPGGTFLETAADRAPRRRVKEDLLEKWDHYFKIGYGPIGTS